MAKSSLLISGGFCSYGRTDDGTPYVTDYMGCSLSYREVAELSEICAEFLKSNNPESAKKMLQDFLYNNPASPMAEVKAETVAEPKPSVRSRGYVYLIQAEGCNRWKIGRSSEVKERLKVLKKQSPFPLVIQHVVYSENCEQLEKSLHQKYRHRHSYGEWFELTPSDVEEIKAIAGNGGAV